MKLIGRNIYVLIKPSGYPLGFQSAVNNLLMLAQLSSSSYQGTVGEKCCAFKCLLIGDGHGCLMTGGVVRSTPVTKSA